MTINDLYTKGADVRHDAKIIIYPHYSALCRGENGTPYEGIEAVPFVTFFRTDVVGYRIADGNVHVALGGEW